MRTTVGSGDIRYEPVLLVLACLIVAPGCGDRPAATQSKPAPGRVKPQDGTVTADNRASGGVADALAGSTASKEAGNGESNRRRSDREGAPIPAAEGPEVRESGDDRQDIDVLSGKAPMAISDSESAEGSQQVNCLARHADHCITETDFLEFLKGQPHFDGRSFSGLEKRLELLRSLVSFDSLVREARKAGLEHHPEVRMAAHMALVTVFLDQELSRISVFVTDEEVAGRYTLERARYHKPERVRASHILLEDRETADRVLGQLREALRESGAIPRKVFGQFVQEKSRDPATRKTRGDLMYLTRDSAEGSDRGVPAAVVEAAFSMHNVEQISEVVEAPDGFHILLLTDRREAVDRPLEEVQEEIRDALTHEKRAAARQQFLDELTVMDEWTLDQGALNLLDLESLVPEGH